MSVQEPRQSAPLFCRPWIITVCAAVAAIQIWALADNVVDGDWFLVVCFAVTSLVFVVLTGVLLQLRRQHLASRRP